MKIDPSQAASGKFLVVKELHYFCVVCDEDFRKRVQ